MCLGEARRSQSGNTLKPLLPRYALKGAVVELIALCMGITEGICEELNGQQQNEALNLFGHG
jgi:hypothetical protein